MVCTVDRATSISSGGTPKRSYARTITVTPGAGGVAAHGTCTEANHTTARRTVPRAMFIQPPTYRELMGVAVKMREA
jgi:hypothetical protein